jgi:hypothetical protein
MTIFNFTTGRLKFCQNDDLQPDNLADGKIIKMTIFNLTTWQMEILSK